MRRLSIAIAGTAVLWPALAVACGACVDRNLLRASWWSDAAGPAAGILFLTCIVLTVVTRSRRVLWGMGFVLLANIGFGVLTGFSGQLFIMGMGAGLLVVAVQSMFRVPRFPRVTRAVAGLGIVVAVVLAAVRHPAFNSTDRLVSIYQRTMELTIPSSSTNWTLRTLTWAERELQTRSDTRTIVEHRLGQLGPVDAFDPRAVALLRLGYLLDGDATRLQSRCATWRASPEPRPPSFETLMAMCSELKPAPL